MCLQSALLFGLLTYAWKWQPTPVLLPGKSHGWRSLAGYSPWGRKESDMTEWLHFHFHTQGVEKIKWSSKHLYRTNFYLISKNINCKVYLLEEKRSPEKWTSPASYSKAAVIDCPPPLLSPLSVPHPTPRQSCYVRDHVCPPQTLLGHRHCWLSPRPSWPQCVPGQVGPLQPEQLEHSKGFSQPPRCPASYNLEERSELHWLSKHRIRKEGEKNRNSC